MNEVEFRIWLQKKGTNKKVQSDCISRLKRIEKEIDHCDIDEQYHSDKCSFLLSVFSNKGENEFMSNYKDSKFPIGKYHMNTYRYALKKYIEFMDNG